MDMEQRPKLVRQGSAEIKWFLKGGEGWLRLDAPGWRFEFDHGGYVEWPVQPVVTWNAEWPVSLSLPFLGTEVGEYVNGPLIAIAGP